MLGTHPGRCLSDDKQKRQILHLVTGASCSEGRHGLISSIPKNADVAVSHIVSVPTVAAAAFSRNDSKIPLRRLNGYPFIVSAIQGLRKRDRWFGKAPLFLVDIA